MFWEGLDFRAVARLGGLTETEVPQSVAHGLGADAEPFREQGRCFLIKGPATRKDGPYFLTK